MIATPAPREASRTTGHDRAVGNSSTRGGLSRERRDEFRVRVGAGLRVVLQQAGDECVHAVAALRVVRTLLRLGDQARVVDQEVHVREAARDAADVPAGGVLAGLATEGQVLVDRDGADAELARLLHHRETGVSVHP